MYKVDFVKAFPNEKKNSYDDFGLLLASRPIITPPEPKTDYVDIKGSNGTLDFTEALGSVTYKDRNISMEFVTMSDRSNWNQIYSDIMNYIHGKRIMVVFSEDPDWYYDCRLSVEAWESDKKTSVIRVSGQSKPFKLKALITTHSYDVVYGTQLAATLTTMMPVQPAVFVSSNFTINFKGKHIHVNPSQTMYDDFVLDAGANQFGLVGSGQVNIGFQEGSL